MIDGFQPRGHMRGSDLGPAILQRPLAIRGNQFPAGFNQRRQRCFGVSADIQVQIGRSGRNPECWLLWKRSKEEIEIVLAPRARLARAVAAYPPLPGTRSRPLDIPRRRCRPSDDDWESPCAPRCSPALAEPRRALAAACALRACARFFPTRSTGSAPPPASWRFRRPRHRRPGAVKSARALERAGCVAGWARSASHGLATSSTGPMGGVIATL